MTLATVCVPPRRQTVAPLGALPMAVDSVVPAGTITVQSFAGVGAAVGVGAGVGVGVGAGVGVG